MADKHFYRVELNSPPKIRNKRYQIISLLHFIISNDFNYLIQTDKTKTNDQLTF